MSYSLPIHLLRQYRFCERIPNFQELLKLNPTRPLWVNQGQQLHAKQKQVFKHRTLKRFGLETAQQEFDVAVSDDTLQLHGIVDSVLITDDAIYPIEFKLAGTKPTKGQRLQLIAYGMLLEKTYQLPCHQGFILFEQKGKTYPVQMSENNKQNVKITRDKIIKNLEKGLMPNSSATASQCSQCEYLNYCNDRD